MYECTPECIVFVLQIIFVGYIDIPLTQVMRWSVVATVIRLRFDGRSKAIQRPFDARSTAVIKVTVT